MKRKVVIQIVLLYHGTIDKYADDILQNGVLLRKSKPSLDFGPGFYTTPDKNFAITTAKRRMKRYNLFRKNKEDHVGWRVLEFECNEECLSVLNEKSFIEANDTWARFILANRCTNSDVHATFDNNIDHRYDIVRGPTSDGTNAALTPIIKAIDLGELKIEDVDYAAFAPSKHGSWNDQFSFHTVKSLSCIRLRGVL